MRNRICSLLLLVCCLVLLPGCWDGRELEKRAIVLMVGVDRAEPGVRVTLQLAWPQSMIASPGQEGGSKSNEPVAVITRAGVNIAAALQEIQYEINRELFFGHVRAILISESAAQLGSWKIIEQLVGGGLAVPRTAWLFVVSGEAEPVMHARPALDRVPAIYLSNFFETRLLLERPYDVTIGGFHQRWVTPGEEPVAVWITADEQEAAPLTILGIAVFQEDQFLGGLSREESVGWALTQNQRIPGRLTVDCPQGGGRFTVRFLHSSLRLRPHVTAGKLVRQVVQGGVSGRIESSECNLYHLDPKEMTRFRQAFQDEVKRLLNAAFERAQQEFGTDIFGFGRSVFRYAHQMWPGDAAWRRQFREVEIGIEIDVQLGNVHTYAYQRPAQRGR